MVDTSSLAVVLLVPVVVGIAVWATRGKGNKGNDKKGRGTESNKDSKVHKSSYYYAHQNRHTEAGVPDKWDGRAQPRLLRRQSAGESAGAAAFPITKYAFSDESSKVKVYITLAGLSALNNKAGDPLQLAWTPSSLDFTVRGLDRTHALRVPVLFARISGAKYRLKASGDTAVLTLTKAGAGSWAALAAKRAADVDAEHAYA
eukprot:g8293.t1